MKFGIFGLWEIIYKAITNIIVIVFTLAVINYYFLLDDKSDTFIIATLYATFLFVVGLYLSYMDKKISDKIYERKSYYIALLRLKKILSSNTTDFLTNNSANFKIIAFRVLSGRAEQYTTQIKREAVLSTIALNDLINVGTKLNKETQLISENGFLFTKKLKTLEDNYLDYCAKIQSKISDSINNYIKDTNIKIKTSAFHEMSLLDTDYEDWCNENIIDTTENKKELLTNYIYKTIENSRAELDRLELQRKKVCDYYKKCYSRIKWNLQRMESIYGNRLKYLIHTNDELISELIEINQRLDNIEKNQNSYADANDIDDTLRECSLAISKVYSRLVDTEENIINAIDVLSNEIDN